MSLSDAPPVKITYLTATDISDEVLGGTVRFCEDTGYKQNVMMLTFLWSGFLLSSRAQLDEHNLINDVLNCYVRSLGNLIPKLAEDEDWKKQVSEMLQHYWKNLNQDFENLNSTAEVSAFLQIANKLNSKGDASSAYLLRKDPEAPFVQVASTIRSNIYRILRQIDNGMTVQYRGIVKYANLPQQPSAAKPEAHPQPQVAASRPAVPQTNNNNSTSWTDKFFVGVGVVFLLGSLLGLVLSDDTPTQSIPQETTQSISLEPTLAAIPEPRSGTILLGEECLNGSELTIAASSSSSCVVKLKTAYGTTLLSFYVRAGDTVTVGVPEENLYVYFASGDTWYGQKHLFGKYTSYSMDDEIKDFKQYTYSYTLYPVYDGNFTETPIDPEDF